VTDHEQDVEALVERAKAGDRAALGELYDRLAGRVYRFALFRVGSRADAEDLMQRTFLKMIETLPRYRQRGIPFEAWFFRLARNAVIDHLRRRRTHEPLAALVNTEDAGPSPEDAAELAAEFGRIREAITKLTPIQQEVIAYRFTAGLTPREVGALMGKREGTVRALQFRALQALRRSLDRAVHLDAPIPSAHPEAELE
jgi:RNA polymerase sigma-70 factor (ECF subfamily)